MGGNAMPFGSLTKLSAVALALLTGLEQSGFVPEGFSKALVEFFTLVAQTGVIWGFRNALAK